MRVVIGLAGWSCLVAAAAAAPRPKDPPRPPVYFPTTVGERWVMAVAGPAGARVTNFEEVVAAGEKDGVTTVTVARLNPDGTRKDEYTVESSADGVCVVAANGARCDRPDWLVRHPTKPGTKWEVAVGAATYVFTVVGEETVETPAGTFKAVRVDTTGPAGTPGVSEWFAVGRGRVQQVSDGQTVRLQPVTRVKK